MRNGGIFAGPSSLGIYDGGGIFRRGMHGLGAVDCAAAGAAAVSRTPCSPEGDCGDDWKTHVMGLAVARCENENIAQHRQDELTRLDPKDPKYQYDLQELTDQNKQAVERVKEYDLVLKDIPKCPPAGSPGLSVAFRQPDGSAVCADPKTICGTLGVVLRGDGTYQCGKPAAQQILPVVTPGRTTVTPPKKTTTKTAVQPKTASMLSSPLLWIVAAAVIGGGILVATKKKGPGASAAKPGGKPASAMKSRPKSRSRGKR